MKLTSLALAIVLPLLSGCGPDRAPAPQLASDVVDVARDSCVLLVDLDAPGPVKRVCSDAPWRLIEAAVRLIPARSQRPAALAIGEDSGIARELSRAQLDAVRKETEQ